MLVDDKIKHCIIMVNQLRAEQQSIKYMIPQLHIAFKLIYEQAKDQPLNLLLLEKVKKQYNEVYVLSETQKMQLEQVHQYMIDQIQQILSQREAVFTPHKIKRQPIFGSGLQRSKLSEQIVIPQQTYYFATPNTSEITQYNHQDSSPLKRKFALEDVPSFTIKNSECDELADMVRKLYSDHKLDQAYKELQQYKKRKFLAQPNFKLGEDMKQLRDMVIDEYEQMTFNYQFFSEPGYVPDKEEKGVKMFYKIYEEKRQVAVRVEAQLQISLENFMCIVSEIDLFQQYVPFSYDTKMLKQIARNRKVGVTKVNIPLLSDRYAYFYAAAYDRLKTQNSIFFFSKTITSDVPFQQKIGYKVRKEENLVQLQYKFYIMQYVPLSPTKGRITLATNVNMQLSFLPLFVINKTCRAFAFDYFKNVMKINQQFKGSEWEKKMKENSEIYQYFRERIDQYLENNP